MDSVIALISLMLGGIALSLCATALFEDKKADRAVIYGIAALGFFMTFLSSIKS